VSGRPSCQSHLASQVRLKAPTRVSHNGTSEDREDVRSKAAETEGRKGRICAASLQGCQPRADPGSVTRPKEVDMELSQQDQELSSVKDRGKKGLESWPMARSRTERPELRALAEEKIEDSEVKRPLSG